MIIDTQQADRGQDMEQATPERQADSCDASAMSRRSFLRGVGGLGALTLLASSGLARAARMPSIAALVESGALAATSTSPAFVHPGLLHTQADFVRMSDKVRAGAYPWNVTWLSVLSQSTASTTWTPNPTPVIYRGSDQDNWWVFTQDVRAAYLNALHWKISGDVQAADCAVRIMNAWSSTLKEIWWADGRYDGFLVAGIQGYQFANVGEIMRTYTGWKPADFARFQAMMSQIFYPMNAGIADLAHPSSLAVYSSWDLCATAAVMAIGVLCDNRAMFDAAVTYFKQGLGNGAIAQMVYYVHPGYLGQTQESGRDQGHDTLSISLVSTICEMAWNQGVDLYGYANNRVLAACEYVAKGNLIQSGSTYYSVPFAPYDGPGITDRVFSTGAQGNRRPMWAQIVNHYVNRRGIAAPYSQKFAALTEPEDGGGSDQFGFGTLTFQRDPIAAGAPPSGLTAITLGGRIVLSWWGSAYAQSYTVKRGTAKGGPYTAIAHGIKDLLTYTDSPSTAGTYYYVVTAQNATGESAPSNESWAVAGTLLDTHLPFADGAGGTAGDTSGHGHAGTLLGGAGWGTAGGTKRTGVALNGQGAYVALPANLLETVGDFTIATWVYWNGGQTWARIFDFGASSDKNMFLTPNSGNGTLSFVVSPNQGYGQCVINAPAALATGQWVHVAVTLNGQTGKLYVNGQVAGSHQAMFFPPCQMVQAANLWIGRSQFANDPTFHGLVSDFRLYRGALSDAQVAALANG